MVRRPFTIAMLLLLAAPVATSAQVEAASSRTQGASRSDDRLSGWRAAFRGAGDRAGLEAFLDLVKPAASDGGAGPVAQAFLATAEVMTAGRRWNPLAKLSGFHKWTGVLDRQVAAAPGDPDIRLLRLAVRAKAPGFLGYRDGIEEDCAVVRAAVDSAFWQGDPAHEAVASDVIRIVKSCR